MGKKKTLLETFKRSGPNTPAIHENCALNYKSQQTLKLYNRQLKIFKETDQQFLTDVRRMVKLRQSVYLRIIKKDKQQLTTKDYDQLHFRARLHSKANSINHNSKSIFESLDPVDRCQCGCKKGKGKSYSFFTNQQKLKFLGPGVLLQFMFTRSAAFILLSILFIYSIFAFTTNYMGNSAVLNQNCKNDPYCEFKVFGSDENKDLRQNYRLIQSWLGVGFCVVWVILLRILKYFGQQKDKIIDSSLKSSSDFAIKVQNLPRGTYEEKQLIAYLEDLWVKKIGSKEKKMKERQDKQNTIYSLNALNGNNDRYDLRIKSIQIIYNMQFSRIMVQEIFNLAEALEKLLVSEDGSQKCKFLVYDHMSYKKIKDDLIDHYELLEDLRKRFFNDPQFRKQLSTTCCLIEFENPNRAKSFLHFFGTEKMTFIKKISLRIKGFFFHEDRSTLFHGALVRIERAPEPSDIQWLNCQVPQSLVRKALIFLITLFVMSIAFGIIFGLTYIQQDVKLKPENYSETVKNIVNNFIGIVLQIINTILWQVMSVLLDYIYNHTKTQKIISQMNRVFILNSINVIALPIFSNYIIYDHMGIFGNEGLAGLAFDYHITIILAVFKSLFNVTAIIKTVGVMIRWVRYKIIWFLVEDINQIDYKKGDRSVNSFYEGQPFNIAENYIFIIIPILHAAFFSLLQPFIIVLVTISVILFYFFNRLKLLKLCKIPEMTEYLVFDTAIWMLGWLPIYFGGGSIVIIYLESLAKQRYNFSLFNCIPSMICMGIGIIGLGNPCGILNKIVFPIINKIIGNIEEEEEEQDLDQIQSEESKGSQLNSNLSEQTNLQKEKSNRMESYFEYSNSLTLLGFEKALRGENIQSAYPQLRSYCQSFCSKNNHKKLQIAHKTLLRILPKIQSKTKFKQMEQSKII